MVVSIPVSISAAQQSFNNGALKNSREIPAWNSLLKVIRGRSLPRES